MTAATLYRSEWATRTRRAPSRPVGSGHEFRPDIAGLRAVAIGLVVLYHAGVPVITGGYVGVDVFFVISGFLITSHLAGELTRTGTIAFGRFYGRRMVRLLPASIVVALATIAATWHWASPLFARSVSTDAVASVGYVMNLRLAVAGTHYLDASAPPSPLQHYWSLAVEEQFYLFWPVVLVLGSLVWLRRGRPSLTAAGVVLGAIAVGSLALCVVQTGSNQSWAYFGLPARAWELAVGGLVALAVRRLSTVLSRVAAGLTWVGLAAVVASALWYTDATPFPGSAALVPVLGAAAVIAGGCAAPARGAVRLLGLRPMQELGRLSYSWYLWHWPVLVLAPYIIGAPPPVPVKLALVLAALVPAAMSLTAVEDRIRFHRVFRTRPRAGLVFGLSLTVLAAGAAFATTHLPTTVVGRGTAADTATVLGSPGHGPSPEALRELIVTSSFTTAMPGNLVPRLTDAVRDFPRDGDCLADLPETTVTRAVRAGCDQHGDPNGTTTAVLFGDSHAEQWFDAVDAVARQQHWRLAVVTKAGCPAAIAQTYRGATSQPYAECPLWRESAFAHIAALRPSVIIMSTRDYQAVPDEERIADLNANWATGWVETAQRLRATGARLLAIADTPDPHRLSIPDCIAGNPLNVRKCDLSTATALDAGRRAAVGRALTRAGVRVIDPTPWLCTTTICPAIVGNTLVYRDDSHVSATYMKLLAPLLAPLIAK